MSEFRYIESHECFKAVDGQAVVSISQYAVDQLGEITFVQLPEVGRKLAAGESFGEVESVKTVSELYAPIAGTVTAVNGELDGKPELINDDTLGAGWMIKLQPESADALQTGMDQAAYDTFLEGLS